MFAVPAPIHEQENEASKEKERWAKDTPWREGGARGDSANQRRGGGSVELGTVNRGQGGSGRGRNKRGAECYSGKLERRWGRVAPAELGKAWGGRKNKLLRIVERIGKENLTYHKVQSDKDRTPRTTTTTTKIKNMPTRCTPFFQTPNQNMQIKLASSARMLNCAQIY